MKVAEYPQRKCREPVWQNGQSHSCEVADRHTGPCASQSVPISVSRREEFEAENPNWERDMREPLDE